MRLTRKAFLNILLFCALVFTTSFPQSESRINESHPQALSKILSEFGDPGINDSLISSQPSFYEPGEYKHDNTRTLTRKMITAEGFLLVETTSQSKIGNSWVNYSQDMHSYDRNNNEVEYLYKKWMDSSWVNVYRNLSEYDLNHNQTEWSRQNWVESAWVNEYRYSSGYDINGNLVHFLSQFWQNSDWQNIDQF